MWRILLLLIPVEALADSVVATRTIRAARVLTADDLTSVAADIPGALTDPLQAIGLEARIAIYAGRPIRKTDLGPPAVVERNQTVPLMFERGGLAIMTEGRALDRGAVGEEIRVMNLSSRATLTGVVGSDGTIRVSPES